MKRLSGLCLLLAVALAADADAPLIITMLNGVSITGASSSTKLQGLATIVSHQLVWSTTGSPATVALQLEGSSDNSHWIQISASGSGTSGAVQAAGFWPYVRANLTSLSSGTLTATWIGTTASGFVVIQVPPGASPLPVTVNGTTIALDGGTAPLPTSTSDAGPNSCFTFDAGVTLLSANAYRVNLSCWNCSAIGSGGDPVQLSKGSTPPGANGATPIFAQGSPWSMDSTVPYRGPITAFATGAACVCCQEQVQ